MAPDEIVHERDERQDALERHGVVKARPHAATGQAMPLQVQKARLTGSKLPADAEKRWFA